VTVTQLICVCSRTTSLIIEALNKLQT